MGISPVSTIIRLPPPANAFRSQTQPCSHGWCHDRRTMLGFSQMRLSGLGIGAANPAWTRIRQRKLGVALPPALSDEAAAGAARLALTGAREAGLL